MRDSGRAPGRRSPRKNLPPLGQKLPRRGSISPSMKALTSKEFFGLLRRRNGKNAARIDRAIQARGARELAILVSDSSGFSRKTHDYGILQFLAVMTRCYGKLFPIIRKRGGRVLAHDADNLLCVFEAPAQAVRTAAELQKCLRKYNRGRSEDERFNLCIGISYGPVVRLTDNVYGAAVNVASKLGEDLADKDEILVTAEVARRVKGRFRCVYARSTEIGGRTFELYRVRY